MQFCYEYGRAVSDIYHIIKDQSTIEAIPVVHGEWIGKPLGGYSKVRCSNCKRAFLENQGKLNFCPNCGADMRKKVE